LNYAAVLGWKFIDYSRIIAKNVGWYSRFVAFEQKLLRILPSGAKSTFKVYKYPIHQVPAIIILRVLPIWQKFGDACDKIL